MIVTISLLIVPASGIILAFATPLVTFIYNPILDYSVFEKDKSVEVVLSNLGLVSA